MIVALISTMVGVFGKSWDEDKKGWRRLTLKGWLVISLALGSFGMATMQAKEAYQAKQEKSQRERLLLTLARSDIYDALNQLLSPFKIILDERGSGNLTDPINKRLYRATDRLSEIGSASFLDILDQVKATDCPRDVNPTGCSWARGFVSAAFRGDEGLRNAVTRYAEILSPATITLIQSVRDHYMLGIMRSMVGNIEINQEFGKDIAKVTVGWLIRGPHEPSDYYVPFFALIQELKTQLGVNRETDLSWIKQP